MAFARASGYNNLPNGVFVSEVFSQNVLLGFRRLSIVPDITNTDYYGEIKMKGDTVRILLEPEVSTFDLTRGQDIPIQEITDNEVTLTVDQAKGFSFALDDIEVQQAHVDYAQLCSNRAAYQLNQDYETDVLEGMFAGVAAGNLEGTSGSPLDIGFNAGSDDYTPYEAVSALERILNLADVPNDGNRFLVADPIFFENLKKEDSKLINADTMGDGQSVIKSRNGYVGQTISGIRLFQTNNAPLNSTKQVLLAGHKGATSTAAVILDSEKIRSERRFADIMRGKMVWGKNVIRPTALAALTVQYS
jgi:hypothetical protein